MVEAAKTLYRYEAVREDPPAHDTMDEENEDVGVVMLPLRHQQHVVQRWRVPTLLGLVMVAAAVAFFARPALMPNNIPRHSRAQRPDSVEMQGDLVSLVESFNENSTGNDSTTLPPLPPHPPPGVNVTNATGTDSSTSASDAIGTSSGSEGDVRIRVCRNENCDKFHPHGLVHEYTVSLNKCDVVSEEGKTTSNGKYQLIGATAQTLAEGIVLTADHCNGNASAPVQHHPFTLTVGKFSDCCSLIHGGCGFKCITFPVNEVPPAYGGEGMEGGDIRIKVCRNEDCDKLHPHGLVHEYTADLNTCARIPEDDAKETNGKYEIVGATASTLADGTILTATHCGNKTGVVQHGPFSLIVGQFTDCCSFRHGGCGFRCITFKQARDESSSNASSTTVLGTTVLNTTVAPATTSTAMTNTTVGFAA